jgi:3-hydroxyacyl-[acyl-carrier-protein] dehydratase
MELQSSAAVATAVAAAEKTLRLRFRGAAAAVPFFLASSPDASISHAMPEQAVLDAIPHRSPFLFVEKILKTSPNGILCEQTFLPDAAFYSGHYPGNPITPGVLLCESIFQASAIFLAQKLKQEGADAANRTPVLCRIEEAKFKSMVFPGETLAIEVTLREKLQDFFFMTGKILRAGKTVLTIRFALTLTEGK